MLTTRTLLVLLVVFEGSVATPFTKVDTRDVDPTLSSAIAAASIPAYVSPDMNRDIIEWLAIGDSFSAGISADRPADEMNYQCSRFAESYPNQMQYDPSFPGNHGSRKFTFGSCSGAVMQDVIDKQIELGDPDPNADYPRIGRPEIGTVSLSGNDLGFGDVRYQFRE
jgi:hypothetical protein